MKLLQVSAGALLLSCAAAANAGKGVCMFNMISPATKNAAYNLYEQGGPTNLANLNLSNSAQNAAAAACNVSSAQRDQAEKAQVQFLLQHVMERSIQENHSISPLRLESAFENASPSARSAIRAFAFARRTNPAAPVPTAAFNQVFSSIPGPHSALLKERVIKMYITAAIAAANDGEVYGE